MHDENRNVAQAAMEVGYESLTQFKRDYRKFFGAAPREDLQSIQRYLKE